MPGARCRRKPRGGSGDLQDLHRWNVDYATHRLKCHGGCYTLSQSFVRIKTPLFNQSAELWVAYFRVVYFPGITVSLLTFGWFRFIVMRRSRLGKQLFVSSPPRVHCANWGGTDRRRPREIVRCSCTPSTLLLTSWRSTFGSLVEV